MLMIFTFGFEARNFEVLDLGLQFADAFRRLDHLILQIPLKPVDAFGKVSRLPREFHSQFVLALARGIAKLLATSISAPRFLHSKPLNRIKLLERDFISNLGRISIAKRRKLALRRVCCHQRMASPSNDFEHTRRNIFQKTGIGNFAPSARASPRLQPVFSRCLGQPSRLDFIFS